MTGNQAEIRRFDGHTGTVSAASFLPGGRRVLTASYEYHGEDQSLRLWDLELGTVLHTWTGFPGGIRDMALSPDGLRIAAGGGSVLQGDTWCDDPTVRVLTPTGGEVRCWREAATSIAALAFSADGRELAVALDEPAEQPRIRVYRTDTWEETGRLGWIQSTIHSVDWTPDGRRLLVGSHGMVVQDKGIEWVPETLQLLDRATGDLVQGFGPYRRGVQDAVVCPDGRTVLSTGATLAFWDLESGECLQSDETWGYYMHCIALTRSGDIALIGAGGKQEAAAPFECCRVHLFDVRRRREIGRSAELAFPVTSVALDTDRGLALCGCEYGEVFLFDLSSLSGRGQEMG